MKIKEYLIDDYLLNPDNSINLFFFIGPDTGLTDERVNKLSRSLEIDKNDPFNVSRINQNDLEINPAKLLDESLTYSLSSDTRFVFLKIYSESVPSSIVKSIKDLINNFPLKNTKIIISARNLSLSLPFIKYINDNIFCNTIVSYQKSVKDLRTEIVSVFSQQKIKITNDALELLEANLGDNQLNTRKALDGIISFIYPQKSIDYQDIIKILPNSRLIEVEQTVFSVLTGNQIETLNNIETLYASGVSPIEIINVFLKWSITLKIACDIYENTRSIDKAIQDSTSYIFWKIRPKFEESIHKCIYLDLDSIIDRLLDLQQKVKSLPNLNTLLLSYSLTRLSKMVELNN